MECYQQHKIMAKLGQRYNADERAKQNQQKKVLKK